jgi:hypothetical protein
LSRVREQREVRAFRQIKEELLRDTGSRKEFLSGKAETLTRRILAEDERGSSGRNLTIEVGKARNYLSKIIK